MFFGLHTTKKSERDMLIESGKYTDIEIRPRDFHYHPLHKPVVCEEGNERLYVHNIENFMLVLQSIEEGKFDIYKNPYYEQWQYKGTEVETRLRNLPALFEDIKKNGIQTPVCCEATGERLDGSFRTKIALYLRIPTLKARMYQFHWSQIDENFIERKLKARALSSGKDYYEFSYGYKDWKNIPEGGDVYRENAAERFVVLSSLIQGQKILDLGCNEGYMALQLALQGREVVGVDHDWTHIANLNRLVYEFIHKKDLPVKFVEKDIMDVGKSGYDEVLLLNVLYHLDRDKQKHLLRSLEGKRLIFQCNLRKEAERNTYYTSHPDDLKQLLKETGYSIEKEVYWKDKPIIIAI